MKISELFEGKDYTGPELWKMAHEVGLKAFSSHQSGLIQNKFTEVKHIHIDELPYPDVDTFGWVFYPSNLSKFKDYSDSKIKKSMADVDGKIYIALSDGSIEVIETTGKKPYVRYTGFAELKKQLNKTFGVWKFGYLYENKSNEQSPGALFPAKHRGGVELTFSAAEGSQVFGTRVGEYDAKTTVSIKPDGSYELVAYAKLPKGRKPEKPSPDDIYDEYYNEHYSVRKSHGEKFTFEIIERLK